MSLSELAVSVKAKPRSYMQSDRTGAFLTGSVFGQDRNQWSIDGRSVLEDISVQTSRGMLQEKQLDSAVVTPASTKRVYHDGTSITIEGLEFSDRPDMHAFVITVDLAPAGTIAVRVKLPSGARASTTARNVFRATGEGWGNADLVITSGAGDSALADGISTPAEGHARFLVAFVPDGNSDNAAESLIGRIDTLRSARFARLERILNENYLRTSDDTLTRAISWMRLSLDALMIERRDTFAVASLPWDGSLDLRANVQAIPGLSLVIGDDRRAIGIFRTLARHQDTLPASPTFGRIADRVAGQTATFKGADMGPWYVRELYEYVAASNDTAIVRQLFPVIRRSVMGTLRGHTDKYNFLVHRPEETWMGAVGRGTRSVEIEGLWYFQQLVASLVSSYLGDSAAAGHLNVLAEKTARNFRFMFTDSVSKSLADHLREDGTRGKDIRPNAILSIDLLDSDAMRFGVVRNLVQKLLSPRGVATLAKDDPRFRAADPASSVGSVNGPVWTWLAGPMTYALTRIDRQDLSFLVSRSMAGLALSQDMVGTLPTMLSPEPAGGRASLLGMAEFLRAMYQDYLGVRIDAASNLLVIQPKLPDELTEVAATVHAGGEPVTIEFRRTAKDDRILIDPSGLTQTLRVNVLWMLRNGDAWRGSTHLEPGILCTIVMTNDDIVLFQGDKEAKLSAKRQLRNFSQKKLTSDLTLGLPVQERGE